MEKLLFPSASLLIPAVVFLAALTVVPVLAGQRILPEIYYEDGFPRSLVLDISIEASQVCVLQSSHDLKTWKPIASYPVEASLQNYQTTVIIESTSCFYRLTPIEVQGFPDIRDSLVAEYKFDELSGTIASDSSLSKVDGQLIGNPGWVEGYCGNALHFDGVNDYVYVGDPDEIEVESYTLTAWCKSDGNTTDPIRQEILEKADSYWMNIRNDSLRVRTGGFYGDCSVEQQWFYTDSAEPVELNTWIHLATTYDGSLLRVYINGQLQSELTVDLPHCTDRDKLLVIGAKKEYDDIPAVAYFSGLLDEVRIYSRALSQEEIIQVMHQCAADS